MRMMKKRFQRLVHDERGANAVLIALLFIPMMGFGALALDSSAQHAERTQLQLGADAAALAIAQSCAEDEGTCGGNATATGGAFVLANGATPVPGAVELEDLDLDENEVTLAAAAEFPHFLASLIDGDADPNHTTVRARAAAEWGHPVAGETIALAIDQCEFEAHPPAVGDLVLLRYDQDAQNNTDCTDSAGGFGWLDSDDCRADISVDGWVHVTTGNTPNGSGCSESYIESLIGTTIIVPVYDVLRGTGNSTEYHIVAFAALELTDYKISGGHSITSPPSCTGNCRGIQGRFVEMIEFGSDFELGDGGIDNGVTIVRLKG